MFWKRKVKNNTISCVNGEEYRWMSGETLIAESDVDVILPGAFLVDGVPIGEIIDTHDKFDIGFQKDEDPDYEGFLYIFLRFKKGEQVTLHRSTVFRVHGDEDRIYRFTKNYA
ncbi:MAG: hypothetical protein H7A51_13800 [Akkermansiaceae bacterium]|nr:hypothetical protein [Akkermansiaceae bacterium]